MESGVSIHSDSSEVQARLGKIILGLQNPQPLMRAIGYAMRSSTLKKFSEERGPNGAWKPLAESTVARRRKGKRGGRSDKILQDTSALKRSIHSVADMTSVDIGTPIHYGSYHQEGAPRANITARPYLYVDAADSARVTDLGLHYLQRLVQ